MVPELSHRYTPERQYGVKGDWIRQDLVALVPPGTARVLSIGCGTGATEQVLEDRGMEVVGVDVSAAAAAVAASRITRVLVGDVESDDLRELAGGGFDAVLCGDVLEHLRFTEHVLDRICGWLRPGGALIVAVPNAAHHSVLRTLALGRDWRYEDEGLFDRGHYRLFTKKSLTRVLRQHGFEVDVVHGSRPMSRKLRFCRRLLTPLIWLMPGLDEHFVYTWTVRARRIAAVDPQVPGSAPSEAGRAAAAPRAAAYCQPPSVVRSALL